MNASAPQLAIVPGPVRGAAPFAVRRILVTGGSGFIGSNLIRHLAAQGHELRNLDVVAPMDASHSAAWRRVDITDRVAVQRAFAEFEPHWLVHLAARTDLDGVSVRDYTANTQGTSHVIAAAARSRSLQRAVFASSRLVCRIGYAPRDEHDYQPTTAYGESKVAGERALHADRSLRCPWIIVRPTSIWGPFFRIPYRNFFDMVRRRRYVQPRGARVAKSFGYVGNSVFQLLRVLEAPPDAIHRRMVYLADYEPLELHAWSRLIARQFGVPAPAEVPLAALRIAARSGDALAALGWRGVPLTSFRLDNLLTPMVHDLEPLRALCGPTPVGLAKGVADTVAWLNNAAVH